ncbi:hypothetical protein D3C75_797270 [compost metagenome]
MVQLPRFLHAAEQVLRLLSLILEKHHIMCTALKVVILIFRASIGAIAGIHQKRDPVMEEQERPIVCMGMVPRHP